MLEPSSSEESDVEGDEPGFGGPGLGLDVSRPGRPIPVLGGRVAGFAGVGAFGFGQTGFSSVLSSRKVLVLEYPRGSIFKSSSLSSSSEVQVYEN